MKNNKLKFKKIISIIVCGLATILFVNKIYAEGLVKGTFSETIDGVEHEKMIEYGKPGYYDIDSMLVDLGIAIHEEDKIVTFPDPKYGIGSRIEIIRATAVVLDDAGEIRTFRTWKTNIEDFFEEINLSIGTEDIVEPAKNEKIVKDINIKITRVSLSELKEYEEIDYKVSYENDSSMERGTTAVKQNGEVGKKELTYMVRRENGKEIERNFVGSEIVKEPIDKIILHGTKVTVLGNGKATWYDWISGNTAAHNSLPMGSMVLVRNNANGKEVVVKIVDRGIQGSAIIDLSADAFSQIGNLSSGVIWVTLEKP